MQSLLNDLTGALRQLRQSPGPALLAILTLALGIGANTAIFTVIESVLLRPLPYAHADRLVYIGPGDKPGFASTSWLNYRDIRDQSKQLKARCGLFRGRGRNREPGWFAKCRRPAHHRQSIFHAGCTALAGPRFH